MAPGGAPDRDELALFPIGSLIGAAIVYVLDPFVLNQGALAVVIALGFLVALVPAAIVGALQRDWQRVLRAIVR